MSRSRRKTPSPWKRLGGWYDICTCRHHRSHFPDWILRLDGQRTGRERRDRMEARRSQRDVDGG